MKKAYYFVGLSLFFFSCSDLKKNEQMTTIDQLSKTVDSLQEIIVKSEIDSIGYRKIATQDVELRIKQNFYSDTLNLELGKKMDAYKVMRRKFGPLSRTHKTLETGAAEELIVLNQLKNDIKSGSGERNKYSEYIQFEKNKVLQLSTLLEDYIKEKAKTIETYNRLHPELLAFSFSLIKNKK